MNAEKVRKFGVLAGIFLALASASGNWLISHAEATSARHWAVAGQAVIALLFAFWCWSIAGRAGHQVVSRT